jgi:hypothetical protein
MSIKDLQKDIRKKQGYIFSDGTLNLTHLLPKAYDLLVSYNMRTNLKQEIESVFTATEKANNKFEILPTFINQYYSHVEIPDNKMEDASYLWNEDIFNYFNNISPSGYYFGSSEGDGACIGWFKSEEEDY